MNPRFLVLSAAALPALGAAPAAAQEPAAGAAGYKLNGGVATQKMRYYAPAQQVEMRGRVTPAVPGEILTLYAIRRGKATKKIRRRVRNGGRFEFAFKVGKPGLVRLVVKHRRSAAQQAFRTDRKMIQVVDWQAGVGERGLKVLLLQRALLKEGFATPVTG